MPRITDEIEESSRTWKMYAESTPTPCAEHVVPLTRLGEDLKSASSLPNFVLISPNLCNDTHDCPVGTDDDWLSLQVPSILASPAFTTQNSLLLITWDEGEGANNAVSTIFAGPAARQGYQSAPIIATT